MANFPTTAPSFSTHSSGQIVTSADMNSLQSEVAALAQYALGPLSYAATGIGGMLGDGATDNSPALATLFSTLYTAGGGEIVFPPSTFVFNSRIVPPNSTGGSYIGAIGSAVPTQPFIRLRGTAASPSGRLGTRFLLNYQSPNSTSATVSGPFSAGVVTFTGLSIPQGRIDIGGLLTVSDGTKQETAVVTAIVVGGGTITSLTATLILSYAAGTNNVTLSWPLADDAPILSLGAGVLEIAYIRLETTQPNDVTSLVLATNTRLYLHNCELRGWRGATVTPAAVQTNQWPTQDGVLLGGPRALTDGSPSSGFAGYNSAIRDNVFFRLRSPWVLQSLVTAVLIENNLVTSSCGSPSNLGAALEIHSAQTTGPNNSLTVIANAIEISNYQQTMRSGTNTQGCFFAANEQPDNTGRTSLASSCAAGASTLSLKGYLPPVTAAPYLQAFQYALGFASGGVFELVRLASITPTRTTTLSGAVAASVSSIVVADATGISAGMGLLLDPGTYGGAVGSTGIQEPVIVDSSYVSGTTIPLTAATVYAHNNGVTVQVGPFSATLQALTTYAHGNADPLGPSLSGYRFEAGATGSTVVMATCNAAIGVRDLNSPAANIVLPANVGEKLVLPGGTTLDQSGNLIAGGTLSPVGGAKWSSGTGAPAGVKSGSVGDLFTRTDGGTGTTLYVKESGAGTTSGWVAK